MQPVMLGSVDISEFINSLPEDILFFPPPVAAAASAADEPRGAAGPMNRATEADVAAAPPAPPSIADVAVLHPDQETSAADGCLNISSPGEHRVQSIPREDLMIRLANVTEVLTSLSSQFVETLMFTHNISFEAVDSEATSHEKSEYRREIALLHAKVAVLESIRKLLEDLLRFELIPSAEQLGLAILCCADRYFDDLEFPHS
jgi:hypothetical protein